LASLFAGGLAGPASAHYFGVSPNFAIRESVGGWVFMGSCVSWPSGSVRDGDGRCVGSGGNRQGDGQDQNKTLGCLAQRGCRSRGTIRSVRGRPMSVRASLELPEDAFSALWTAPEEFGERDAARSRGEVVRARPRAGPFLGSGSLTHRPVSSSEAPASSRSFPSGLSWPPCSSGSSKQACTSVPTCW